MNIKRDYKYLLSDLSTLKGVGLKTTNLLKKKKINSIFDLIWKLPKSYTDRSLSSKIKDLKIDEVQTVTIVPQKYSFPRVRNLPNRVLCKDETGEIDCVFFNSYEGYIKKILPIGKEYFCGITVIVWIASIFRSLIFEDKLLSVYDFGNFHNKSRILFIFFFLSRFFVLIPTPLRELRSDNKYL